MNRRAAVPAVVAACAALAACVAGPDYHRPPQALPSQFRQATAEPGLPSFADLHWRDVFADPALRALIDEALQAAPDLQLAATRVRQAEAAVGITRADGLPQLALSLSTAPTARAPGDRLTSTYTAGASIRWELDLWGKLARADEAARADLLASVQAQRGVVSSLIASVAGTYYQLLAQRELLAVTDAAAANQREALRLVRRLSAAGVATAAEEAQQEVALTATEASVPTLRGQISQLENALSLLLGRVPGPIDTGADATPTLPATLPAGLPSALLERRPDILAAEQQLVAANARLGVAKAMFFPSLSLTGLFGRVSNDLSSLPGGSARDIASLGFDVLQPLFAGGALTSNEDVAAARLEAAVVGYRKSILVALGEVSDALAGYQASGDALLLQQRRVRLAREARRLADLRYRVGTVSLIEVLEAQRQQLAAETEQVQSLLQRRIALTRTFLALGGGWTS